MSRLAELIAERRKERQQLVRHLIAPFPSPTDPEDCLIHMNRVIQALEPGCPLWSYVVDSCSVSGYVRICAMDSSLIKDPHKVKFGVECVPGVYLPVWRKLADLLPQARMRVDYEDGRYWIGAKMR